MNKTILPTTHRRLIFASGSLDPIDTQGGTARRYLIAARREAEQSPEAIGLGVFPKRFLRRENAKLSDIVRRPQDGWGAAGNSAGI